MPMECLLNEVHECAFQNSQAKVLEKPVAKVHARDDWWLDVCMVATQKEGADVRSPSGTGRRFRPDDQNAV